MTKMEQLEMIFNSEQELLEEEEKMLLIKGNDEKEICDKYKYFMNRQKKVLETIITLLKDYNRENAALIENKAMIERQNYFLKRQNEKLYAMCAYDTLTEVYTRRFLMNALGEELKRGFDRKADTVVAIVDIDNFKTINDNYGHQDGDKVLKSIAKSISDSLRPEDIVGRYGGEEFVIILPNTPIIHGKTVIERIRNNIAQLAFTCKNQNLTITASFGMTIDKGEKMTSVDSIIFEADQALSIAKKSGKNKTVIYDTYASEVI